jgi:hypothetical protein
VALDHAREGWLAAGERLDMLADAVRRANHQATLAA